MNDNFLVQTIIQALNPDSQIRKPAETQLLQLETSQFFCSSLFVRTINIDFGGYCINKYNKTNKMKNENIKRIVKNDNLDASIRLLAVVNLKNIIYKYWSKKQTTISNEEKEDLKSSALARVMMEPNNQVALQLSLIISNIYSFDFLLQNWPSLFPNLFLCIERGNEFQQARSFQTLHHIIKGLISKKLQKPKQQFQQVCK